MPYRKNYNYSKKKRYNKSGKQRGKVYGAAASQLWKDVNYLKGLVNTEFKKVDVYSDTTYNATPTLHLVSGIAEGDDIGQRSGREVRIKSLLLNMLVYPTSTTKNASHMRMILFKDTQPQGSAPTYQQLLDNSSGISWAQAPRNLENRKRFRIIKDKHFLTGSLATGNNANKHFQCYLKLDDHIIFGGTGGTISSIQSNAYYILFVSNHTGADVAGVQFNCRIRYIDN